ncbi:uncharacterized protein [Oscarella lobularis]|uniref:uncharacterized protein isoform X1 n=1 Tax=Oscarella lobularis TaxID=121494 RepID=UPI0033139BD7
MELPFLHAPKSEQVKNKYIVVLDNHVTVEQQLEHVSKIFENSVDEHPKIEKTLNIGKHFKAYSAIMNNATLERVLQLPHVQYVMPEEILRFRTLDKKMKARAYTVIFTVAEEVPVQLNQMLTGVLKERL